jgi:hypothetical protein
MNTDNIKDTYIQIIDQLNMGDPFVKDLKKFIKNYDSPDISGFNIFMLSLIQFIKRYKIANIKSGGYDKLKSTRNNYEASLHDLKQEYAVSMTTESGANAPVILDAGAPRELSAEKRAEVDAFVAMLNRPPLEESPTTN